jgi:hypothetical protein
MDEEPLGLLSHRHNMRYLRAEGETLSRDRTLMHQTVYFELRLNSFVSQDASRRGTKAQENIIIVRNIEKISVDSTSGC